MGRVQKIDTGANVYILTHRDCATTAFMQRGSRSSPCDIGFDVNFGLT